MALLIDARRLVQVAAAVSLLLFHSHLLAASILLETGYAYPADDGLCGLIEAIDNANDDALTHPDCPPGNGADIITLDTTVLLDGAELFPPSNPLFFDTGDSGLPEITSDITIRNGAIERMGDLSFRFFVVQSTGRLTLEDLFLIKGRAVGDCPGFSGSSFTGCGGAVVVFSGQLTLMRAYLFNNSAEESEAASVSLGGAIMMFGGMLTVSESRFAGNQAEYGGALAGQSAAATIAESLFEKNSAANGGGAVYSRFPGEIIISGSTFSDNHVSPGSSVNNGGGAIDNSGSNSQLTVIGSVFTGNSAPYGGAIKNFNASDAFITDSLFDSNSSNYGGAILNHGSGATLYVSSSTISGNTALQGAGIANGRLDSGTANVFDTHFTGNTATTEGGGMSSRGPLLVRNSWMDNNMGGSGGGLAIVSGGNQVVTVDSSRFTRNFANRVGGGIFFEENPSASSNMLTLSDSTFDANEADEGGGLFAEVVDVSISGSSFSNNIASNVGSGGGGGINFRSFLITGMDIDIINTTVSGNSAAQDGGGIYLNGSALDATITATTIANNSAASSIGGDGIHSLVAKERVTITGSILSANSSRNCLQAEFVGYTDGGSNISSDTSCGFADGGSGTGDDVEPLLNALADNGGRTSTHALQVSSPAINAVAGDCPGIDQRGAARLNPCDIGAFEANVSVPAITLSLDETTLIEADATVATLSVTLDNSGANAQPVNVEVFLRVTGSANGLGFDYTLSNQNDLDTAPAGVVIPLVFNVAAGGTSTKNVQITAVDDSLYENVEQIEIEAGIKGFARFTEGNRVSLEIVSDDPNPIPETSFRDGFEFRTPTPN